MKSFILLTFVFIASTIFAEDYKFQRHRLGDGSWSVNNPAREDSLAKELSELFTNSVKVVCVSTNVTICVEGVLSPEEVSAMTNLVALHQVEVPMANRVADWNNSKTNFPDIITWENKFMARLGAINAILIGEGRIASPFTPQNSTPLEVGAKIAESSHQSIGILGLALDADLKYVKATTEKFIGTPPDDSEILIHVKQH